MFRSFAFWNNGAVNCTLGPGRPIPVSPWIPDGPGSPRSPCEGGGKSKCHVLKYIKQKYIKSDLVGWV